MNDLPQGWLSAPLAAIADVQLGRQRSPKNHSGPNMRPYLRAANVTWDGLALDDVKEMNFSATEAATFHLIPGDILLSEASGSASEVGKPAMWRGEIDDCCFQNTLLRVRSRHVLPKYLLWFFKWLAISGQFARGSRGVGIHHLGAKALSEWDTPIAPMGEQKRIVTAIEEQFSRLDAGVASLERVRLNLKRMRTAALQSAVVDALKSTGQQATPLAQLLSAPLANGKSVPDGPDDGFPVLRLTAVRDGWIDVTCSKRGAWTAAEARPYMIQKGDYLVVRGNGSKRLVGRGAMVGTDTEVAYPDTLIRLRFNDTQVLPSYAALVWDSPMVRSQIEEAARTTAGIYKINQKDLARITFPVPSINEQAEIHASAESVLYGIRVLEAKLNTQLQRSGKLRSSILTDAFSGRLVPQNPTDEPASALLQRIAAERASSNGRRPKRGRKPRVLQEEVTA